MLLFASKFDGNYLYDPSYAEETIVYRVFYLIGCMHVTIYRLYFAFGSMESNMIACGVSFRAKNEKEQEEYNSIKHVQMMAF